MKALVIGKGGREHALVHALLESSFISKVFALPGNQGMGKEVTQLFLEIESDSIHKACIENGIELVVIGPEDPLVQGLATQLRQKGLAVFGPGEKAAQLEGSKIYSKKFMEKHNIPTADFEVVGNVEKTLEKADNFTPPYVLKADGLAAGKGVFICKDKGELEKAATDLFENKILGEAGREALLEQFQPGYELSFFILTTGTDYVALPMAQDHKKIFEEETGPNTGGMGTVAPMKISETLYRTIIEEVVEPTQKGIQAENFDYKGVVFIGIMVTDSGPQVLEYNVRFGDPETQVLLPLLDGDWGEAFYKISQSEKPDLKWKEAYATCVVLAAEKYPESSVKDVVIEGDFSGNKEEYFLHAGTKLTQENQWVTNGGRVLNAVAIGSSLKESIKKAYRQADKVCWPGRQMRKDIGKKALDSLS